MLESLKRYPKSDGHMSKRHRDHLEGASAGQTWDESEHKIVTVTDYNQ